jgi:hypothetical protein
MISAGLPVVPGAGETTAVGDLAAVPGASTTSLAILVSALTAAPAARPS